MSKTATFRPVDRELAVPLKSMDHGFVVTDRGRSWVEHFEAEVGLSRNDRKQIMRRAMILDLKYDVPVWTTIILMSPRYGRGRPARTQLREDGTLRVSVEPRIVRLWEHPARSLVDPADVRTLPWAAAMKTEPGELDAAIDGIRAVTDTDLRSELTAQMVFLGALVYDKEEVERIRWRLGMATSLEIALATYVGQEVKEFGRKEGRQEGRKEGVKEGRLATSRRHLVALIESRVHGRRDITWVNAIDDPDLLDRIFDKFLAAPNEQAARAVLDKHRSARSR